MSFARLLVDRLGSASLGPYPTTPGPDFERHSCRTDPDCARSETDEDANSRYETARFKAEWRSDLRRAPLEGGFMHAQTEQTVAIHTTGLTVFAGAFGMTTRVDITRPLCAGTPWKQGKTPLTRFDPC